MCRYPGRNFAARAGSYWDQNLFYSFRKVVRSADDKTENDPGCDQKDRLEIEPDQGDQGSRAENGVRPGMPIDEREIKTGPEEYGDDRGLQAVEERDDEPVMFNLLVDFDEDLEDDERRQEYRQG